MNCQRNAYANPFKRAYAATGHLRLWNGIFNAPIKGTLPWTLSRSTITTLLPYTKGQASTAPTPTPPTPTPAPPSRSPPSPSPRGERHVRPPARERSPPGVTLPQLQRQRDARRVVQEGRSSGGKQSAGS